jgi:hypothetical protein
MRTSFRRYALVGAAAIALALSSGVAQARGGHWHGHGGHWGGGFGPGFVSGLALGAVGGAYYGGYGYYGPYAYGSGPDCYIRRTVVVNRWGHRFIRRVRVCD